MSKHFEREVAVLHERLLRLFAVVERMIFQATRALGTGQGESVVDALEQDDDFVNAQEVVIEEECLKILALHQPVASELRTITTVIKINIDLERIADLACNIAERVEGIQQSSYFPIPDQISRMAKEATDMVRKAINAFVFSDLALAKQVILDDIKVDQLNRDVIQEVKALMMQRPEAIDPALHCFSLSRHLERIADHAENIAEEVIYMISGDIIRHKHGNFLIKEKPDGQKT
jgi:phosphate transport system protein